MDTHLKVLAELVRQDGEYCGMDKSGNYWVIIGIIQRLEGDYTSAEHLKEEIYTLIAEAFAPDFEAVVKE